MNTSPRRKPVASAQDLTSKGATHFFATRQNGIGSIVLVLFAMVVGVAVWAEYRDQLLADPRYLIRADRIDVVGVPMWLRSDIKSESLRDWSFEGEFVSTDPQTPKRLARAFDMHPWVKRVLRVVISHPGAATVELICREPIAMVAVPGGLLAVDADAVVLPSADFSGEIAAQYPCIRGVESSPQGPAGSPWGDVVVEEGVGVVLAIGPEWKQLFLTECRPKREYDQNVLEAARWWGLHGPSGLVILYGSAPGQEKMSEPLAAEKVSRLQEILKRGEAVTGTIDLTRQRSSAEKKASPQSHASPASP